MKVCGICDIEKQESDFHANATKRDGLQSKCKLCQARYLKQHYEKNKAYYVAKARKAKVRQYLLLKKRVNKFLHTHPCVDCGEADPVVLEFDHVRGAKLYSVSVMVCKRGSSWKAVQEEIAKCEVRCANCHRRKTAKQMGYWTNTAPPVIEVELISRQLLRG